MTGLEEYDLDAREKLLLLRIARESMEQMVRERNRLELGGFPLTSRLQQERGAFVTLRNKGELRGCIGYTRPRAPLAETVRDNAINASTRDPRFNAVASDELEEIRIEISVLGQGEEPGSPYLRVEQVEDIEIGRDGLYIERTGSGQGGLLLPQVPVEQEWNIEQFLEGVCRKAGLSNEAWKGPDVSLYRFTAQVFSDDSKEV